jgi:hypothetical protein
LSSVLCLLLALGLVGCPAHDDDDDDTTDTPGDDDDATADDDDDDDATADDDDDSGTGDDDDSAVSTWDCYANPLDTAHGADGSGMAWGVIDGHETWFVVDTAAQVIFADLEISDDFTGYFAVDVDLGPFQLEDWSVKGRDLTENQAAIGTDIGALLGQDVLMRAYTTYDPSVPQVYLCDAVPDEQPPGTVDPPLQQPYTLENQFAIVDLQIGAAGTIPLMLDSGMSVTYLTEAIFDQVDTGASRLFGWVFSTSYGSDDAFVSRIPEFQFGGEILADQEVVVIPTDHHLSTLLPASGVVVDGFLGNSVLDRYVQGFNGLDSVIDLWPVEAAWNAPGRWTRVGIEPAWRDGLHVVEYVLWPSDAQDQGIEVGDVLVSIDGVDCTTLGLWDLQVALRGAAGETRQIEFERAGVPFAAEVAVQDLLP